jgi:hypothetical protein
LDVTDRRTRAISVRMWIVARFIMAIVVGLIRFFWRTTRVQRNRVTGAIAWRLSLQRGKYRVVATTFGLAFEHPVFFRLARESGWDRFFKRIGFAHELQTGDAAFDATVYVTCDHPALAPVLQADAGARAAILALFDAGAQRIFADGANLWVRRAGHREPDATELALLATVREALQAVPATDLPTLRDPYFWRALGIGAVAWSLALYGLPATLEAATRVEPLYFQWKPVITLGLIAALGVLVGLVGLTWVLLRGSSRSHRIFLENALVLTLGLPFSMTTLVSDLNISLDRSPAVVLRARVQATYTTISRSRHGSHTHYHVRLAPQNASLPRQVEVSSGTYVRAHQGGNLIVTMHAGALGVPWVQEIHPES